MIILESSSNENKNLDSLLAEFDETRDSLSEYLSKYFMKLPIVEYAYDEGYISNKDISDAATEFLYDNILLIDSADRNYSLKFELSDSTEFEEFLKYYESEMDSEYGQSYRDYIRRSDKDRDNEEASLSHWINYGY